MARNHDDQEAVRQYLLRQLSNDEQRTVEQRLLSEDELFEELEIAEDELIDQYLAGQLANSDREKFKRNFLATAEGNQKLRFAQALGRHPNKKRDVTEPGEISLLDRLRLLFRVRGATLPLAQAAVVLIVVSLGFVVWRGFFYQSGVDRALVALNTAYREQRPVEARITELNYAPFRTTRGPGAKNVDEAERQRAEYTLLEALHNTPTPAVHHALGRVYLAKNDFDRAIEQFEEALKADPNNGQVYADLGAALLEKGRLDKTGPEAGKGMEELARSRENLNKALELNSKLLEAIYNRALVNELQLLPEQAKGDWREYLKRDPNSSWATEAREHLKRLEEQSNNRSAAKEQLQRDFLVAYESGNQPAVWAAVASSRAREGNRIIEALLDDYLTLAKSGETEKAADKLRKISSAGRTEQASIGDHYTSDLASYYGRTSASERNSLLEARSLMKAGQELYGKGEFSDATNSFLRAKELFARSGDECEALFAESWVGYCYLRIPKTAQSIEVFERLSRKFEAKNYRYLLAQSLPALADAESSLNEFSRTLAYDYRGLKLAQEIEDIATEVRCLGQIVSMHLALGEYRQSLEAVIQGVSLAETVPAEPRLMWQFYFQAALDFHLLNFPASAIAFEDEALRLADAANVPLLKSRSWEQRGTLYGQQKNYEEAIKSGEQALAEAEKIKNELPRKNMKAHSLLTLGKLRSDAGDPRQAIAYFDQSIGLYKQLDFPAYFYEAHKGKLLALIALSDNASADTELRTVLTLFEAYRDKVVAESSRDTFFDAGQDTYDVAIDFAFSKMDDPNRAFAYAEGSRARSLFEMMNRGARVVDSTEKLELNLDAQTKSLTLAEIQLRMPQRAQVLQYSVLADKLVAWVITRQQLRQATLAVDPHELNQQIEDFQALNAGVAGDGPRETPTRLAKQLYASLISPLETLLDKNLEVCIVADKRLNYVPFAALVSPATGRYLIEDYTIEMSPSASVFVSCSDQARNRSGSAQEKLLSIGNPSFDHDAFPALRSLPAAEREARRIGEIYPSRTVLVGNEAVAGRVKKELGSADVIHFATHAVTDEQSPLLSKLLLASQQGPGINSHHASNGFLQASDIYQLALPRARLVVLSACQTGIERALGGEGAIGLARPFLATGVPIVVASLWPVDSDMTSELMISFHKFRRVNKLPTVEALRRAQLAMIHNAQPGTQSNNGWAAFIAIGGYADY
jgi:CHAT domain-containing protein/Flp pilus assembly protein TadD